MYGNSQQMSALAMTGASVLYWSVAAGVLIFAGIALITIAKVLNHKRKKRNDKNQE